MTPKPAGRSSDTDVARQLANLGTGTAQDRLGFRAVMHIFVRSLPLLRPVVWHLVGVALAVAVGGIVIALAAYVGFDAIWQGVLQGKPLLPWTARLLSLDPATFCDAKELDAAARTLVRDRLLWAPLIAALPAAVVGGGGYYYLIWILQSINQHLRIQLMERLQTLSLRFHSDSKVGDSIYRVYQDSAMVTNVIRTLLLDPILGLVWLVVAAVSLAWVDLPLAGIVLATFPPSLVLGYVMSGRLRMGFRGAREANSALTSRIQESVAGIRVIKAFGAEQREQERFEQASLLAFAQAYSVRSRLAVYGVLLFWFSASALLFATYTATFRTVAEGQTAGLAVWLGLAAAGVWNLAVYNFVKGRGGTVSAGIERLFTLWGRAQDIAIGLDRVYEVLDLEPEVAQSARAVAMPPVRLGIRFDSITFGYRRGERILRKVNLHAKPGTITALIGPTGSGKSTLMALLLRLYDPDEGSILIDGVDVREIELEGLRAGISIALQENLLFRATIRENIAFASPSATDEQIRAAARVACADTFIRELPLGYDTPLGERGTKLSTGQRQRLSIARAVLKDTPILILDEPTASLDAETELAVLDNLVEWGRGRAIFIITHRLSTIRRADQIVVLREGEVLEEGSHPELMRRENSGYRRLVEIEDRAARAGMEQR
jgi:ABC-type multidrug transport system fused ATPase/permease subunit